MNTGPVQPIPTDDDNRPPEPTPALCLSGGGYRAMVFHIGVLWRLYETGLLKTIKRISSVSGGSITAGQLALAWRDLSFGPDSVRSHFIPKFVEPLRALRRHHDRRGIRHPGRVVAGQRRRPHRQGV